MSSNLPANVTAMKTAIAASVTAAGASTGNDFYAGMDRYGTHYYGADRTEVEPEDIWAANVLAFEHGFTCWGTEAHGTKGQNVGEVVVPIAQPMPLESDLPDAKGNWSKCISMQLRCTQGEDEGVQIRWKSNSHGGRKAYSQLMLEVMEKINADDPAFIPLIHLKSDSYNHKEYGKIFTPEFEVVGWTTLDGEQAEEPEAVEPPAEEPEAEEKPQRRRRRKAS